MNPLTTAAKFVLEMAWGIIYLRLGMPMDFLTRIFVGSGAVLGAAWLACAYFLGLPALLTGLVFLVAWLLVPVGLALWIAWAAVKASEEGRDRGRW